MCTVTWLAEPDRLHVLCNRDESRQRLPANPPQLLELEPPTTCLAPIDADAGGTWLAVNNRGLIVTLLNYYRKCLNLPQRDYRSRGQLVLDLMSCSTPAAVQAWLNAADLACYRPFKVLAFGLHQAPRLFTWDARETIAEELDSVCTPITSSGFASEVVTAERLAAYRRQLPHGASGVEDLVRYHRSHNDRGGAFGVLMQRPDACTVSFSHLTLTAEGCHFRYLDRPHETSPEASVATMLPLEPQGVGG